MVVLGEMLACSQSTMLLPQVQFQASSRGLCHLPRSMSCAATSTNCTYRCFLKTRLEERVLTRPTVSATWAIHASVIPESVPTTATVNSAGEGVETELDTSGSGGDLGGVDGGGDSGGGGGGNNNEGEGEFDKSEDSNKKIPLSMSQKLTLGYALLVGVGGIIGYLKAGSWKSLYSAGMSVIVLLLVYYKLPTNPAAASLFGVAISASLLGKMGMRFKETGKIIPAGLLSLVSLIMTGGYVHGIIRGMTH